MMTAANFERILARLAGPGLAAWVAAAALALAAVVLIPGTETRAYAPALLSTAVLVLATGRFWTVRRLASEMIGLGVGQVATVLVACTALPKPFDLALLPLASLCVIVGIEAANAWRFAPDEGQGSDLWMFTHAFPSCMGPVPGLAGRDAGGAAADRKTTHLRAGCGLRHGRDARRTLVSAVVVVYGLQDVLGVRLGRVVSA